MKTSGNADTCLFQMAFKYLSWALFPLLVCYAIYSVIYQEHRGWYSWVLSMAYGFLLTFGKSQVCLVCDNRFTYYHAKFGGNICAAQFCETRMLLPK